MSMTVDDFVNRLKADGYADVSAARKSLGRFKSKWEEADVKKATNAIKRKFPDAPEPVAAAKGNRVKKKTAKKASATTGAAKAATTSAPRAKKAAPARKTAASNEDVASVDTNTAAIESGVKIIEAAANLANAVGELPDSVKALLNEAADMTAACCSSIRDATKKVESLEAGAPALPAAPATGKPNGQSGLSLPGTPGAN